MMKQQQYVRGTRLCGDYCCRCCCSSPAILPAGRTRMYLACDTIIMDFASSRSFHCFVSSINANPLHTRSTSYFCNSTICFITTPYPLAAICRFYDPSSLGSQRALRACAESQVGASPPRRSPPCKIVKYQVFIVFAFSLFFCIILICLLRTSNISAAAILFPVW